MKVLTDSCFSTVTTVNHKQEKDGPQPVVSVNKPVQLYIAFSDQATEKPNWLDPFQDTGEDLIKPVPSLYSTVDFC